MRGNQNVVNWTYGTDIYILRKNVPDFQIGKVKVKGRLVIIQVSKEKVKRVRNLLVNIDIVEDNKTNDV